MKPSLGVLIGLPAAGIITILCILVILWAVFAGDATEFTFGGFVCLILTLGITAFTFWPYHWEYHSWQPKQGTIASISNRFIASDTQGGGTTQRFVVTFTNKNDPGPYSCDDTRCSLLHKGDFLQLSCKREWQYSGNPGWSCNFVDARQKNAG